MGMSGTLLRPRASGSPAIAGAPTNLTATTLIGSVAGDAQVLLTWSVPASNGGAAITDYAVQFSSNGGATWNTFGDGTSTVPSLTKSIFTASPIALVSGLTIGTAYTFRVAAVNSAGTGSYSDTASATPVAPVIVPSLWKVETLRPSYHWSV